MTSKDRIIKAINHKEPDKIPVDFNSHRSSGIAIQAYKKLREHIGLKPSPLYVYDVIQQLAVVEDDVLNTFGVDVVQLGYDYYKEDDYWKDWILEDGTQCKIPAFVQIEKSSKGNIIRGDDGQIISIQKKGLLYFEQTYFPLLESNDNDFNDIEYNLNQVMWSRIGSPPAPAGFDPQGLKEWEEAATRLRKSTDRAIYGIFGGNLMEIGQFLFRIDNFFMELASNPKRVHKFLDKLVEFHLSNLEKFLSVVGRHIDIIGFGDDLGMQTGPQISPQTYREFFKPGHSILWNKAKEIFPHLKVSLHCCGSIYSLLPDLIEAGLDIINPVQISAKDMDLNTLKKEFGKDMVFWGGGCDTRQILPYGSKKEIKEHVKNNIAIMSPGGGFVFQQVHNILANVPPENIAVMFMAVRE